MRKYKNLYLNLCLTLFLSFAKNSLGPSSVSSGLERTTSLAEQEGSRGALLPTAPARTCYVRCYVRFQMSDVRCQLLDVRCQMLAVRCQMLDVRCQMLAVRCQMLAVSCQLLDVRCQMLDNWYFHIIYMLVEQDFWENYENSSH